MTKKTEGRGRGEEGNVGTNVVRHRGRPVTGAGIGESPR